MRGSRERRALDCERRARAREKGGGGGGEGETQRTRAGEKGEGRVSVFSWIGMHLYVHDPPHRSLIRCQASPAVAHRGKQTHVHV
eukprot:4581880-Pleurochrysis_carterae.AAC.1